MGCTSVMELAAHGRVITGLAEVTDALYVMGVTIETLQKAMDAGEVDRNGCSANNPPTDAGSRAHGTTVRVLREEQIRLGWAACNKSNFATVVAPDLFMEIAVASGDDATGNPDREPRTKNKKGELVQLGVAKNLRQSILPLPGVARVQRTSRREALTTWILLRYRPEGRDEVRSELSLPISIGNDGRVNEWGTRIILPVFQVGGGGSRAFDPVYEKIDIAVVRKSA